MNIPRISASTDATAHVNCGTCVLRDRCRDRRKARTFACTLWIEKPDRGDPASAAFAGLMRDLVKRESVLPEAIQIDDRDAPEAPSFFAWCMGKKFLNMKPPPYPKQMQYGMKIFGDACPYCSDKNWFLSIPYNCDIWEIPRRIQLRRFGRCPKCDRTILDGIRDGLEGDVNTFLGVVGQRSGKCITGDALVPTTRGTIPLKDVQKGDYVLVHDKPHYVKNSIATPNKTTYTLKTTDGYTLRGTPDHRFLTPHGFQSMRKAKCIRISAEVCVRPSPQEYLMQRLAKKKATVNIAPTIKDAYVASLPEVEAINIMKAQVARFDISGDSLCVLVDKKRIGWFQQALLQWNIFSQRHDIGNGSWGTLALAPPYSIRYLKTFGINNNRIARHVWLTRGRMDSTLPKATCDVITDLLKLQGFKDMMADPAYLQKVNLAFNQAQCREMTRADAALALRSLKQLPITNGTGLLRVALVETLRFAIQGTAQWSNVASVEKSTKATVFDIEVPTVKRFIANGMVVHNSTGIGLVMTYHTHKLLKLKNPSAFYGIKQGTILHNNIIGINYTGAKQNVFDPLMATIEESPWFQCIVSGTPVRMADGSQQAIETISPGNHVKTLEGSSIVDQVFDNGVREVVEIELSDGKILRLTDDHEVRCVVNGVLVWLPIKDVDENTMVAIEGDDDIRKPKTKTCLIIPGS